MSEFPGLVDYHIHPGYSIDAQPATIDQYCRRAVELHLEEICFTTHLEVDPVRRELDWFVRCCGQVCRMDELSWLDQYFRDIQSARKKYLELGIKAGIEVGYEPGQEKRIEKILQAYPFDFVLGSVHCLDHVAISSKRECSRYFSGRDINTVAGDYFRILEEAARSGLFDCIAHVDLYRRYGGSFLGPGVEDIHRGRIESIFRYMAGNGIGLEINTSGLRRGLGDIHPSTEILRLAINNGIKIFTTGSDAHSLSEIGKGLDLARRLMMELCITPVTYTHRKPNLTMGVDKPSRVP